MSPRPRGGIAPPPPALGGGGGGGVIPLSSNPDMPITPQDGGRPDTTARTDGVWESPAQAGIRSQSAGSAGVSHSGLGRQSDQSSSNGGSRSNTCSTARSPQYLNQ